MELNIIIFTLPIVLSIGADYEHEAFQFEACSNKEEEFYLAYDEEELWHVDFDQKKGVETSPNFTGHMTFPGFYDRSVVNLEGCKSNLLILIKGFKSPPPQMGECESKCSSWLKIDRV